MVLAFLILSVSEKASGVIHSTVYSLNRTKTTRMDEKPTHRDETDELAEGGRGPTEMNEDHKTQYDLFKRVHQYVVEDMKSVLQQCSIAGADASLHPIEKKGAFFLNDADAPQSIVVWHSFGDCCFVLMCDGDENIALGGLTLRHIIHSISSHVVFVTPSELLAKAGLVHAIVKLYLPSGKLLFVNQNVVRQYEQLLQKVAT
ncbi:unnamed protein product [Ixodes hexagonus]